MRVTLLGSGSALSSATRANTSVLVQSERAVLVDCSGTPTQALARLGVDWPALGEVILTHRHPDHVYGLLSLAHQRAVIAHDRGPAPLVIRGQVLALAFASELLGAAGLLDKPDLLPLRFEPLPDEEHRFTAGDLEVTTFPVSHGDTPALGVKLSLRDEPRRAVLLSGDTSPCEALARQSRGARLLVHECSVFSGERLPGHTSLEDVPALVEACEVERIVLVHLPPVSPVYEGRVRRELARRYGGRVILGEDGRSFEL